MNRYFALYVGLNVNAPWGVAVERVTGNPKAELLMLCRTEPDAMQCARLTALGAKAQGENGQQNAKAAGEK